tara:strand:- start:57 stop:284 length:228 start_codon:yes stop_codon:yes gene_type:complete
MGKTYTTHDLSVAAFLLMNKQRIVSAERDTATGKYIFTFDNENEECRKKSIDFLSSECCAYDGFVRTLRGLLSQQ